MGLISAPRVSFSMEMVSSPLRLADDVKREAFAGFVQDALRLLGLLKDVGNLRERGDLGDDVLVEQEADLVDHHQAAGDRR